MYITRTKELMQFRTWAVLRREAMTRLCYEASAKSGMGWAMFCACGILQNQHLTFTK